MDKTAKSAARVALGGSSQGKQLSGPLDLIFDQLEEVGKSARRLQSSSSTHEPGDLAACDASEMVGENVDARRLDQSLTRMKLAERKPQE